MVKTTEEVVGIIEVLRTTEVVTPAIEETTERGATTEVLATTEVVTPGRATPAAEAIQASTLELLATLEVVRPAVTATTEVKTQDQPVSDD